MSHFLDVYAPSSEDPYTVGEYATSFVLGFEHTPEDENHLQASACCKHYVANSMEGTTQNGIHWDRNDFDAQIPMQDLVDSYLPPFQVSGSRKTI